MKRFKFPIRTTPEGSIQPYEGKPKADMANIKEDKGFFNNEGKLPYEGNADELILLK